MPLSLGKQLRGAEVERLSQPAQAPQAGIAPTALDVGDPPLGQAGLVGHLLLGQPQLLPPLLDLVSDISASEIANYMTERFTRERLEPPRVTRAR
jgi:hypothetical protein